MSQRTRSSANLLRTTFIAAMIFLVIGALQDAFAATITGTGTASLSWDRPTESEDGLALPANEIAGYVVYWGPQSRFAGGANPLALRPGCSRSPATRTDTTCYQGVRDLLAGTTTTLTIPLTQDVTLSFAVVAVNTRGEWSAYSNELRKLVKLSVQSTAPPNAPVLQTLTMEVSCTTDQPTITCTFTVE